MYAPVNFYHLHCIYTTTVGPLFLSTFSLLWHLVAKMQNYVKQTNNQNNTQARAKMTLITTQDAFLPGWANVVLPCPEAFLIISLKVSAQTRTHGLTTHLGVESTTFTAKDTSLPGFPSHHALEASRPTGPETLHPWWQAWLDGTEWGGGPVWPERFAPHHPPGEQIPQLSFWYLPDLSSIS